MDVARIAIVGLGRGFMLTLPALQSNKRIKLSGAFDLRAEARDHFARQFGAVAYDSLDALLRSGDIDAVYIATPHELHRDQSIAALSAGKHVLVEKPMATGVADCIAMNDAARAAGRVLVVGPSHGFDAPVQRAAELVSSGRYGPVRFVTAMNFTDFMFRPRRPEELDSNGSGGVIYSQGAHQIDVVRRIVGQPVSSVRAIAGAWDSRRPSEGAYSALMSFEGGAAATLTYSGNAHYDSDELVDWISELGRAKDPARYGDARRTLGSLSAEDEIEAKIARTYRPNADASSDAPPPYHEHFGFMLVSCERADLKLSPKGITVYGDEQREFLPIAPPASPRSEVIEEFVAAVRGERTPVHDGQWGLDTMACCAAIRASSRLGTDISPNAIIKDATETAPE